MNKKLEQIIENHGITMLSASVGLIYGTIDVSTTDLPLLTIGAPCYDLIKTLPHIAFYGELIPNSLNNYLKNLVPYSIGALIPFAITHSNEIANYISLVSNKI